MPEHVFGGELSAKDYQMFATCGVPRELVEAARVRRVDTVEGREVAGRNGSSGNYAGVIYGYTWPGEERVREFRLRRDQPDPEQDADGRIREKDKYVSPPGRGNLLYFPPRVRPQWVEDSSLRLILCEGEKKCLSLWNLAWQGLGDAAERPRFLPVGLSGVWSWRGKVAKQDGPNGERQDVKGPIPDLARIEWSKREVVILFDANVHSNANVRIARACLATELRKRGAHVLFADIPQELHVNGIDDVSGQLGAEAALGLIAKAYDPKQRKTDTGQPSKIVIDSIPSVRTLAAEEIEFLVPGLIVKGTITVFSGEAGGGKSHLAFWLSHKIASAGEIFGEKCQQHPVLYLTRENPLEYAADILKRLNIEDGADKNLIVWGDWLEEPAPSPASPHVLEWVSKCPISPYIVVDPLVAFLDGQNENDSAVMRPFLNQGRTLIRAGACGVLLLHHPGKAESSKVYRGSSDLKPAIDSGYTLSNSGDGKLETLRLKSFKIRFLAQKHELVLHYSDGGFLPDERPVAVYETVTEQLKKLLQDLPGTTKTEFENAAHAHGLTRRRARQFLESGVLRDAISQEKGPRNANYYTLKTLPMEAGN